MLAEIRKYGESMIIADQIPNKLTPEVLKNTNTKIVHTIFAQDDKDAIGGTMSLTKDQRVFLSNLKRGRAVIFTEAWDKPIQVEVDKVEGKDDPIEEKLLRDGTIALYAEKYKRGIIDGSEFLKEKPDIETMDRMVKFGASPEIMRLVNCLSVSLDDIPLLKKAYREFSRMVTDKDCRSKDITDLAMAVASFPGLLEAVAGDDPKKREDTAQYYSFVTGQKEGEGRARLDLFNKVKSYYMEV